MENKEYLQLSAKVFRNIEDQLDEYDEEIDYEKADGKLELIFESGAPKVVLNTQRAIHEIWLAGNARAWHFQYQPQEKRWFANAEQVEFYTTFSELVGKGLGRQVQFQSEQ